MSLTITAQPSLNKVDQFIKAVMLTYPISYKSRMAVLKRIFLDSTSFGWDAAGCPDLSYFGGLRSEMEFGDLDQQCQNVEAAMAGECCASMALHYAGRAVALKRQYADRELVSTYIDILAVEHTQGEDAPMNANLVDDFRIGQNQLHSAPYHSMDKDWALAAEEVLTAARHGISVSLGMSSWRFNPETADMRLLHIHRLLTQYLDQLDGVTGTKAADGDRNQLADRLIGEVLAEEANR
jgi:hypothetical protein